MKRSLQYTVDILDEGLYLYRKGFLPFVLIASLWFVPIAIGVGLSIAAAYAWGTTATLLIVFGWLMLSIPLMFYLVGGLSRATLAMQEGRSIALGEALSISPVRLVGMGCYGMVFYIVSNIITSVLSMVCICPSFMGLSFFLGSITSLADNAGRLGTGITTLLGIITMLLFMVLYGMTLAMSGATYSSLIYAIQPFAQEQASFGDSLQRSLDLLFYRFGQNLIAFVLASTIFAATALIVTIAIGVLLPLPLFWALGTESPIALAASGVAWLIGLIVVLPPLPIWMALFYQHNLAAYTGDDLAMRIAKMRTT